VKINAGIMGHRPTKLFIITTDGRIDNLIARMVLWVSARTWGRYTRWYPQNIVTIATMFYFVFSMANIWAYGIKWGGWDGVGNVGTIIVVCAVCAWFEFMSWKLRGLSGHMTQVTLFEILEARRAARSRAIAGPFLLLGAFTASLHPNAGTLTSEFTWLAWMWSLYTLTMGRSAVPPKKERVRRSLRLPSLLPRLMPVRS
jgi:hypothetical protein